MNHPYSADFHTVDFICSWIDLNLLHTRKGTYSTMRYMDAQTIFTELYKKYIDVCVCTACTCFSIICPVLVEQINELLMYYMKSTISSSVSGLVFSQCLQLCCQPSFGVLACIPYLYLALLFSHIHPAYIFPFTLFSLCSGSSFFPTTAAHSHPSHVTHS